MVTVDSCDDGSNDCDLKIYLGWYGTDKDGIYIYIYQGYSGLLGSLRVIRAI